MQRRRSLRGVGASLHARSGFKICVDLWWAVVKFGSGR
jgi:hypothetical protein